MIIYNDYVNVWISAAYQVGWRSRVSDRAGEGGGVVCGVFWWLSVAIRLEENKERDIDAIASVVGNNKVRLSSISNGFGRRELTRAVAPHWRAAWWMPLLIRACSLFWQRAIGALWQYKRACRSWTRPVSF